MIMKNYMENKLKRVTSSLTLHSLLAHWPPTTHAPFLFRCFFFRLSSLFFFFHLTETVSKLFAIPFRSVTFKNIPPTIFHQPSHFACLPLISFAFFTALPFFSLYFPILPLCCVFSFLRLQPTIIFCFSKKSH